MMDPPKRSPRKNPTPRKLVSYSQYNNNDIKSEVKDDDDDDTSVPPCDSLMEDNNDNNDDSFKLNLEESEEDYLSPKNDKKKQKKPPKANKASKNAKKEKPRRRTMSGSRSETVRTVEKDDGRKGSIKKVKKACDVGSSTPEEGTRQSCRVAARKCKKDQNSPQGGDNKGSCKKKNQKQSQKKVKISKTSQQDAKKSNARNTKNAKSVLHKDLELSEDESDDSNITEPRTPCNDVILGDTVTPINLRSELYADGVHTTPEINAATTMLELTRQLNDELSALNRDSRDINTPLHNSSTERRLQMYNTPLKRTPRKFQTLVRSATKSVRSLGPLLKTPAKSPGINRTPTSSTSGVPQSPESTDGGSPSISIMKLAKTPPLKSPVRVHFAELPAKHRSNSLPRTKALRQIAQPTSTTSPAKRKSSPNFPGPEKKRRVSTSSPNRQNVKRKLQLDLSPASDVISSDSDNNNEDSMPSPSRVEDLCDSDSCSEPDNSLQIVEEPSDNDPLDKLLDEKIRSQGLKITATNVKALLKSIIYDEGVQDMVRNTIQEEGVGEQLKEAIFEARMTRSRVKQVLGTSGQVPGWPISPVKKPTQPKEHNAFINMTFSDEEEDDDYDPTKDIESGDDESIVSSQHSEPGSPVDVPRMDVSAMDVSSSFVASDDEVPNSVDAEDVEMVALRTRSKVPMTDTTVYDLEANFTAPDITSDMYDTYCDDQEWQHFLASLTKDELNETLEDENNDPEYNYMAEKEEEDEDEKRNDKAVRVSKKEVNLLMDELMEAFGEDELPVPPVADIQEKKKEKVRFDFEEKEKSPGKTQSDKNGTEKSETAPKSVLKASCKMSEMLPLSSGSPVPCFTSSERRQLEDQMRKHVQLLSQTIVLSAAGAEFQQFGDTAKSFIGELRALGRSSKVPEGCVSAFHPINLKESEKLLDWKHPPPDQNTIGEIQKALRTVCRNTSFYTTLHSPSWEQMEMFLYNQVFLFPQMLPNSCFLPSYKAAKVKEQFVTAEDNLIACGLEQFKDMGKTISEVSYYIQKYMLPVHSCDKIIKRIRQLRLARAPANAIQFYMQNKKLPKWQMFPDLEDLSQIRPPVERDHELLPSWFKGILKVEKLRKEREKENEDQEFARQWLGLPKKSDPRKKSVPLLGLRGGGVNRNVPSRQNNLQNNSSAQNSSSSQNSAQNSNALQGGNQSEMETSLTASHTVSRAPEDEAEVAAADVVVLSEYAALPERTTHAASADTVPRTPKVSYSQSRTSTPLSTHRGYETPRVNPVIGNPESPGLSTPGTPGQVGTEPGSPGGGSRCTGTLGMHSGTKENAGTKGFVNPGTPGFPSPATPGTPGNLVICNPGTPAMENPGTPGNILIVNPERPVNTEMPGLQPGTPSTPGVVDPQPITPVPESQSASVILQPGTSVLSSSAPTMVTNVMGPQVSVLNSQNTANTSTASLQQNFNPIFTQAMINNKPVLLMLPQGAQGTPQFQNQQWMLVPVLPPIQGQILSQNTPGQPQNSQSNTQNPPNPEKGNKYASKASDNIVINQDDNVADMEATTRQFLGTNTTQSQDKPSSKNGRSKKASKASEIPHKRGSKRSRSGKAKKQLTMDDKKQEVEGKAEEVQEKHAEDESTGTKEAEDAFTCNELQPTESTDIEERNETFTVLSIPDNEEQKDGGSLSVTGSEIIKSAWLLAEEGCNTIQDILGSQSGPHVVKLVQPAAVNPEMKEHNITPPGANTLMDQLLNVDTTQMMSLLSSPMKTSHGEMPLLSFMTSPQKHVDKSHLMPDFSDLSQFAALMASPAKSCAASCLANISHVTSRTCVTTATTTTTAVSSSHTTPSGTSSTNTFTRPIPVFALSPAKLCCSKLTELGELSQISLPYSPNKSTASHLFSHTPASGNANSTMVNTSMVTSTAEKHSEQPIALSRPIPKFVGFLSPVKGGPLAVEGETMNISLCLEPPETSDDINLQLDGSPDRGSDILCTPAKAVADDDDLSSSYWSSHSNASTPNSLPAHTPEKLPNTPTKQAVEIMQRLTKCIVTPPKDSSPRPPPKTPSPQKFISGLNTPEKYLYSPGRYRLLAPKPLSNTPQKGVSPLLKKTPRRSPRRKILQDHVRAILPKGFVLNTYISPTKRTADNLKAKAKKGRRPINRNILTPQSRRILPNLSKLVQDTGVMPDDDCDDNDDDNDNDDGTSEYDTLDSAMSDDQGKQTDEEHVKRKVYRKRRSVMSEDSGSDVDSQGEDQDPLTQLMRASSTIQIDPDGGEKRQLLRRSKKKKAQCKLRREATRHMLAPDLLENDPKKDERDVAFAQDYVARVRAAFKADPKKYEDFIHILRDFSNKEKTALELHEEINKLLSDHVDLREDFAVFLSADQAQEAGCYMTNFQYTQIKQFLRKLEVYYRHKTGHFQRIIKTLLAWEGRGDINVNELVTSMEPLLKDQQHLLDEFRLFCGGRPPENTMTEFEEVTLNSDEDEEDPEEGQEEKQDEVQDPEEDGVEEIDLIHDRAYELEHSPEPCTCSCHGRPDPAYNEQRRHCIHCGHKVIIRGTMYVQTGNKNLKRLEVAYDDQGEAERTRLQLMAQEEEGEDIEEDDIVIEDGDSDENDDEDGDDNDQENYDENGDDDDYDEVGIDGENIEDDDDDEEYTEHSDDDGSDDDNNGDSDGSSDIDEQPLTPSALNNDNNAIDEGQGTSGKNDTWTREQDKYLIEMVKTQGGSQAVYSQVAEHLKDKTVEQVAARMALYMSMLMGSEAGVSNGTENDNDDNDDASAAAAAAGHELMDTS